MNNYAEKFASFLGQWAKGANFIFLMLIHLGLSGIAGAFAAVPLLLLCEVLGIHLKEWQESLSFMLGVLIFSPHIIGGQLSEIAKSANDLHFGR